MNSFGKIVLSFLVIALAVSALFIPLPKERLEPPPPSAVEAILTFEGNEAQESKAEQFVSERDYTARPKLIEIPTVESLLIPFKMPVKSEDKGSFIPLQEYREVEEVTLPPRFDYEVLRERIEYPLVAKRQNREGRAVVRLYIDQSGQIVKTVVVKESSPEFGQAALNAFSGLKVEPARLEGEPIAVTLLFPLNFTLR
ncbi:MAG: energy transducer TonB [Sphaerochaetaceae bacterium]